MNHPGSLRALIIILIVFFAGFFPDQVRAQQTTDSDAISAYLDTLELTPDERTHLQQMYQTVGMPIINIVGGEDADIADYPWTVAIVTAAGQHYCGGTIIDKEWILTAAHCIGSTAYIRAGVSDKNDDSGQDRQAVQIINHENYEWIRDGNDISLLRLSEPLDLSDPNVDAVGISTVMHNQLGFENEGVMSTITGWGRLSFGGTSPMILQAAEVPVVSNELAQEGYPGEVITESMLAAGFWGVGGVDTCQGDSGGPLVVPEPDAPLGFVVAGITSWGDGCAEPELMGIYTRISYFEQWIEDNSGLVFQQPGEDDGIPPSAVTDLAMDGLPTENSITLSWTAPGGSGDEGRAAHYDIRFSTSPFDETDFENATQVENPPRPAFSGETQKVVIKNLEPLTTYYIALKASDFFGNISALSNVAEATTDGPPQISLSETHFSQTLAEGQTGISTLTITNTGEGLLSYVFPAYITETVLNSETASPLKTRAIYNKSPESEQAKAERAIIYSYVSGKLRNPAPSQQRVIDAYNNTRGRNQNPGLPTPANTGDSILIEFESLSLSGSEFINVTANGYAGDLTAIAADFILESNSGGSRASDFAVLVTTEAAINSSTVVLQVGGFSNYGAPASLIPWGTGDFGADGTPVLTTISIPTPLSLENLYVWIGNGFDTGPASSWTGTIELIGVNDTPTFITSVSPSSGSIPVGEEAQVAITFDATGLENGLYEGETPIMNNDLSNPSIPLTFELLVEDPVAGLVASVSELDFGQVYISESASMNVGLTNESMADISLESITTDNPVFFGEYENEVLAPGETITVTVEYSPLERGLDTGVLSIESNAPNGTVQIGLIGEARRQAELLSDFNNLDLEVEHNSVSTVQLVFTNPGDDPLSYTIGNPELSGVSEDFPVQAADIFSFSPSIGEIEPDESVEVMLTVDITGLAGILDPQEFGYSFKISTDSPLSDTLSVDGSLKILVAPSDVVTFTLNMALYADEGLFEPTAGDQIFVMGGLNAWEYAEGEDFSPMYETDETNVFEYTQRIGGQSGDMVEYKFLMVAGDGRDLPNDGWETDNVGEQGTPNRVVELTGDDNEIMLDLAFFNNDQLVNTEPDPDMPAEFVLNQNYPNPFNPVTIISYALPEASDVRVEVFNLQGQRIAVLVNGYQPAGHHSVSFDAISFASGVYLYRIQAGSFTRTNKMMLVK